MNLPYIEFMRPNGKQTAKELLLCEPMITSHVIENATTLLEAGVSFTMETGSLLSSKEIWYAELGNAEYIHIGAFSGDFLIKAAKYLGVEL